MNNELQKIINLIPIDSGYIDWGGLEKTSLNSIFDKMKTTNQNPKYHGEIDVFSHTRMVCEALVNLPEYKSSAIKDKRVLFMAALLHDVGKIKCTVVEDGRIKSPHHAAVGAIMARELLWSELGLCGDYENQQIREAICTLIRYHSYPSFAMSNDNPEYRLLKIAANGELTRDFTMAKLCTLEKADVIGRICNDQSDALDKIELCRILCDEIGCLNAPFQFANDFSKRAYFKGKTKWKEHDLYNDSWGEVILMSGMPGTGKDTWIKNNCSNIPMVSLDEIRKELGILPTDNQGRVIALGYEMAREHLRRKESFVWNATNVSSRTRGSLISLFEEYGASVKTVFLETSFEEQLRRNSERREEVPASVIEKMLSKLEVPERAESESVVWETV